MKEKLLFGAYVVLMGAAWVGILHGITSPEYWHAGEHTAGCNGTDECGCFDRLMEAEKKNSPAPKQNARGEGQRPL